MMSEKKVRQKQDEVERYYNRVFSSKDGKAVLEDLAKTALMYKGHWVAGCNDSTHINLGMQRLFLYIAQKVRMDITEFYKRRQEAPALPKEADES